jgi:hypothetical protein
MANSSTCFTTQVFMSVSNSLLLSYIFKVKVDYKELFIVKDLIRHLLGQFLLQIYLYSSLFKICLFLVRICKLVNFWDERHRSLFRFCSLFLSLILGNFPQLRNHPMHRSLA